MDIRFYHLKVLGDTDVRRENTDDRRVGFHPPDCLSLARPENIRQGWKGLQGTHTLAYYEHS
jgi:hypothetical protein